MADKHPELNIKHLDRRVVERYVKKGLVDEKEFHRHLKALPDLTEQSVKIDTQFEPAGELGPSR